MVLWAPLYRHAVYVEHRVIKLVNLPCNLHIATCLFAWFVWRIISTYMQRMKDFICIALALVFCLISQHGSLDILYVLFSISEFLNGLFKPQKLLNALCDLIHKLYECHKCNFIYRIVFLQWKLILCAHKFAHKITSTSFSFI